MVSHATNVERAPGRARPAGAQGRCWPGRPMSGPGTVRGSSAENRRTHPGESPVVSGVHVEVVAPGPEEALPRCPLQPGEVHAALGQELQLARPGSRRRSRPPAGPAGRGTRPRRNRWPPRPASVRLAERRLDPVQGHAAHYQNAHSCSSRSIRRARSGRAPGVRCAARSGRPGPAPSGPPGAPDLPRAPPAPGSGSGCPSGTRNWPALRSPQGSRRPGVAHGPRRPAG
jgi:hypothetical protein